jgi:hypothetical protein
MKILFVHGIGRSDNDPNYYVPWKTAVTQGLKSAGFVGEPQYVEFHYDDLFEKHDSGPGVYFASVIELLGTAAVHAVTDPVSNFFHGMPDAIFGAIQCKCFLPRQPNACPIHTEITLSATMNADRADAVPIRFWARHNQPKANEGAMLSTARAVPGIIASETLIELPVQ